MQIVKRAWSDTWQTLGGVSLVYPVIAIPVVGLGLHYWISGDGPMNAELEIWLIYGLAATGVVFFALFFWNLVCAPYRLLSERLDAIEKARTLDSQNLLVSELNREILKTVGEARKGVANFLWSESKDDFRKWLSKTSFYAELRNKLSGHAIRDLESMNRIIGDPSHSAYSVYVRIFFSELDRIESEILAKADAQQTDDV